MIFAVDFDDTLSLDGTWPDVGRANESLIDFLKDRQQSGDKLILWTCRAGDALDKAIEWCTVNGLKFDAVNDNLPEIKERYGNNSRKISCDYYIDDKAVRAANYIKDLALMEKSFDYDYVTFKLQSFADELIKCS